MLSERRSDTDHAFNVRWVAESLRLAGSAHWSEDDPDAIAAARNHPGSGEARVLEWARVVGARNGMSALIENWNHRARLVLVVLCVLALVTGLGVAFAVFGDGSRPVNVVWTLGGLLGVHVLSLLLWFAAFLLSGRSGGGAFGRLWLWLSGRLAPSAKGAHVAHALFDLHGRGGLTRWWLGAVTHGLWLLMLGGALTGMLIALATRSYDFVWETTILSSTVFESFVAWSGWLPSRLGFAVPDADLVRASGLAAVSDESARRVWSSWLIGSVVVYGVLIRLLLWLLCFGIFLYGRARLRLDLSLPEYARLLTRLTPDSERMGVTDAAPPRIATARVGAHGAGGHGAVLVGIELREDAHWPPVLPAGVRMEGVLDSREQRKYARDTLSSRPPARLLIACDPRLSPDRGSLALIVELAGLADAHRVWLRGAASTDPSRLAHWIECLSEIGMARENVIETETSALAWLEGRDEA